MRLCCSLLALSLVLLGLARWPQASNAAQPAQSPEKVTFAKHIAPILAQYCTYCHGGAKPRARLALDKYKNEASVLENRLVWEQVAEYVRNKEMPPPSRPQQPSREERQLLINWIETTLKANACTGQKDPGRVTLRRLNRVEYNNTIRDLVGVNFQPAEDFPADDVGYGFDNIGDVLTLPPLLLEKYLAAAEKIVTLALASPQTRQRIFICRPADKSKEEECARKLIENFARRAYRRPIRSGELDRLAGFVRLAESQGDGFDTGIELALQAILTSPHFLYRIERDPQPMKGEKSNLHITEYELASRLSYFLWSTMPDDELFKLADKGELRKQLVPQVRRMLNDTRSRALVENFAGQWLQTRNLKNATPDPGRFPSFDEPLRAAMAKETELVFESVLREDRSILDFLDADYTFVNERLARHYGIAGVKGDSFRRVTLTDGRRGGILTQASVLTVTSNPTRTSPVKRGKWILENILGTPPPPSPPDVPELSEDKSVVLSGRLRQRMEQHRANPNCAVCHQRMDPLGFGFENFDAVGAWRDRDGQFPIDPSGTLPGGQSFKGPAELKALLKTKQEAFSRCLSEKMLTYALGRGLEAYDKCAVDQITGALAGNGYRFTTLVLEIVKSDPFQMRRKRGDR
jgi:mono/diheme cytochrome c family protein